jgi:hypothetical protein
MSRGRTNRHIPLEVESCVPGVDSIWEPEEGSSKAKGSLLPSFFQAESHGPVQSPCVASTRILYSSNISFVLT